MIGFSVRLYSVLDNEFDAMPQAVKARRRILDSVAVSQLVEHEP